MIKLFFLIALFNNPSLHNEGVDKHPFPAHVLNLDTISNQFYYYAGTNAYTYTYFGAITKLNDSTITLQTNVDSYIDFVKYFGTRTEHPVFCPYHATFKLHKIGATEYTEFLGKSQDTFQYSEIERSLIDSLFTAIGEKQEFEIPQKGKTLHSEIDGSVVIKIIDRRKDHEVYVFNGYSVSIYKNVKKIYVKPLEVLDRTKRIALASRETKVVLKIYKFTPYYKLSESVSLDNVQINYCRLTK